MSLRAEIRDIGIFGGQIALSEVVLFSIFLTDVLMLGLIGELSLSAALLINSTFVLCFVTALGFLQGSLPLAAAQWEQGDQSGYHQTVTGSLLLAGGIALIFAVIFLAYVPILRALGYPTDLIEEVWRYLLFILPGFACTPFYITIRNAIIATGDSSGFMVLSLIALALNAGLNYVLGFGIETPFGNFAGMGISGIGLSSSLIELSLCAGFAYLLLRKGIEIRLPGRAQIQNILKKLTLLGIPIGVIFFVDSTLFSGVIIIVGRHDIPGMAAMALIFEWVALAVMIPVGFSEAIVQRVAMIKSGPDAPRQIPILIKAVVIMTGLYLLFLALIQFGFGLNPPEFFIIDHTAHPGLVQLLRDFALLGFAVAAMNAFIIMIAGILRGMLDVMTSMYAIMVCYWGVGIGLTFVFMELMGLGTWYAFIALATGTALATLVIAFRLYWLSRQFSKIY